MKIEVFTIKGPRGVGKSTQLVKELIKSAYVNPGRWHLFVAPNMRAHKFGILNILKTQHQYSYNRADRILFINVGGGVRTPVRLYGAEEEERLRDTGRETTRGLSFVAGFFDDAHIYNIQPYLQCLRKFTKDDPEPIAWIVEHEQKT